MSVVREDKILLARSPRFPEGMYSTLAGFVEPGEILEEAVRREVREETGIEVDNIRYVASQPWPFPHSLMIGFSAIYAGGEIRIDDKEIEAAGWFARAELPLLPSKISIARLLIDNFVNTTTEGQIMTNDPYRKALDAPPANPPSSARIWFGRRSRPPGAAHGEGSSCPCTKRPTRTCTAC